MALHLNYDDVALCRAYWKLGRKTWRLCVSPRTGFGNTSLDHHYGLQRLSGFPQEHPFSFEILSPPLCWRYPFSLYSSSLRAPSRTSWYQLGPVGPTWMLFPSMHSLQGIFCTSPQDRARAGAEGAALLLICHIRLPEALSGYYITLRYVFAQRNILPSASEKDFLMQLN